MFLGFTHLACTGAAGLASCRLDYECILIIDLSPKFSCDVISRIMM